MYARLERFLSPLLITFFVFFTFDCDSSGRDVFPLFPSVADTKNEKCLSLPENIRLHNSSTDRLFSCSVSGLTYDCVQTGEIFDSRTFTSIEAAKLGLIETPFFHIIPVSQRGLESAKVTDISAGGMGLFEHYTYSYDSESRLVSRTDELNSGTYNFNDYNTQGFPRNGGEFTYTFAPGQTRPNKIEANSYIIDYDENGWTTRIYNGSDYFYVTNTGTLSICPE